MSRFIGSQIQGHGAGAVLVSSDTLDPVVIPSGLPGGTCEWVRSTRIDLSKVRKYYGVDVRGDSLRPRAWPGQKVLVDEKVDRLEDVSDATLAVVETATETLGNVIKNVFPGKPKWTLISPNPVDKIPPDIVSPSEIRAIWPVRGVLFETAES